MASGSSSRNTNKLKKIESGIVEILKSQPDCTVLLSSFWTIYKIKHGTLPSPQTFGVTKLGQLLELCDSVCALGKNQAGDRIVTLLEEDEEVAVIAQGVRTLSVDEKLQQLKGQIRDLLQDKPDGINKKQFWKHFHKHHDSQVRVAQYNCVDHNQVLGLCQDVFEEFTDKTVLKIRLKKPPKTTRVKAVCADSKPEEDTMRRRYDSGPGMPLAPPGVPMGPPGVPVAPPGVEVDPRRVSAPNIVYGGPGGYGYPIGVGYGSVAQQNHISHGHQRNVNHSHSQGQSPNVNHSHSQGQSHGRGRYESPYRGSPDSHRQRYDSGSNGPPSKKIFVPKDQMENVARDCIERLAESKKYVSVERIEKLILQHYSVTSLAEMNVRQIEHIKPVYELMRIQCRVNAYIQAFIKTRAISTLHELSESLCGFVADGKEFESINLGPLVEQPLIYEFFKFPTDGTEIPEITTEDIFEYLRCYLTEKNMWTTQAVLEDFMNYLNEKRSTSNPFELGIRIRSLPLAIQCLKRAQRDSGQSIRGAMTNLKSMAENDLTAAFTNFIHSVMHKEPGICQIQKEYLNMTPKAFMSAIFQKLNILYSSINYLQQSYEVGKGQLKDLKKSQDVIHQFLGRLQQDKMLQKLFQMAISCSQQEIHLQLQEILSMGGTAGALGAGRTEEGSQGREDGASKAKPTLSDLLHSIKKYIERCLSQGLSLAHLARIENKILEDLDFPHFHALGHTSFLDVITKNEQMKKFMEDCGAGSLGFSSGGSTGKLTYNPTHEDLMAFLYQCGVVDPNQAHVVEDALCYHYRSPDGKSLGHGSMSNLLHSHVRQQDKGANSAVFYESALVARAKPPVLVRSRKAGVLGHQTKDRALSCLENCPLLADLHDWSHWDIVFQPELGDLKTFIQKYGSLHMTNVMDKNKKAQLNTAILALETNPGRLLKITAKTSSEKMASAAFTGDVRTTCGHLVSLIVSNKGIENTGLVLLGNHVKTALIKMQAERAPGGPGKINDGAVLSAKFVVDCLTLLPSVLCLSVAQKVFLDPLSQVVGHKKSQNLLMDHATTAEARGRLHLLGMLLGLEDWSQSFTARTRYSSDNIQHLQELQEVLNDVIMIDEDSDEDSSEDDEDDIDVILSDDYEEEETKDIPSASVNDIFSKSDVESADDSMSAVSDSEPTADSSSKEVSNQTGDPDLAVTVIEEPVNRYKLIIDEIRRDEFGIGVTLGGEDAQRLWGKQQERLGRTLDRLSKDLYSKDTHFVLELIQNADDNTYPKAFSSAETTDRASVKFVVDREAITILNNECGFEEKNIRAVCDVGRSTKGKHKYGYIGQKGIGFKSVFRVTDTPEIHSNGYHIRFDVNSGPTGYILPHWVGTDGEAKDRGGDRWTTKIVLPLKADVDMQSAQSLAARFHDVHPSLLLFLHRLKHMTVVNKVENYTLKVRRQDIGDNIVEIRHTKGTDRWFVVKKSLDASKISLQAKSGVDVVSTEIAMAFPLQSQENINAQVLPPKQPVFAFLPLRSYGFRFVVQGDFDVPSSREDVDRDSLWNQWLASELHHLFVESLQAFKNHPDFNQIEAVCQFLQFVPLEGEILDFFQPIASQILQLLRAQPCLPSAGSGSSLQWKLPSQLIFSRDPLLRNVIPSALLREHLSLDYLHPDVAAILNPTLMQSLGVQTMSLTHLLEIRKTMLVNQGQSIVEDADIIHTAKWLTCIYRAMDDLQHNEEVLASLRKLATMPLASGQMVSLDDQAMFFPLGKDQRKKPGKDLLLALASDLNTVHPLLLQGQDSVANSQVCSLLEMLGVKRLTPQDITHHHIMPVLKSDKWQLKPRDLLVSYVVYIKEQLEANSSLVSLDELREAAVILTNHGPKKLSEVSVHFTPAYQNRIDLQKHLPGYDWILLDACYMVGSTQAIHVQNWRNFFSKLGVLDFLNLKPELLILTRDELKISPWKAYCDIRPDIEVFRISDVQCEEFETLILRNCDPDSVFEQSKIIFQVLDQAWDGMYSKDTILTHICDKDGRALGEIETSFAFNLKNLCWVPAVVSVEDDDLYQVEKKLLKACDLFVDRPDIMKLLSLHVPYLEPKFSERSTFTYFLGVHFQVKIEFVKQRLISWCDREESNIDEPRTFLTSLDHMKEVYKYLHGNLLPTELDAMLRKYPMIYTVQSKQAVDQPDMPFSGRFMASHEVRWADPSGLFEKHRVSVRLLDHQGIISKPMLCFYYKELKDFFLKCARVQKVPSVEEYTQLLLFVTMTASPSKEPVDVLQILSVLGKELQGNAVKSVDDQRLVEQQIHNVKVKVGENRCLPGKARAAWISLSEGPLIADDKNLERMFQGTEGVVFVDYGEKIRQPTSKFWNQDSPEAILFLYKVLGVQRLSECIEIMPTTEMYAPCPSLQLYVHEVVGFIQRLLVASHVQVYESLEAKGVGSRLASMTFGQVGKLELVYTLRDRDLLPVVQSELCQINDNQFSIHRDHIKSFNEINKELARYFSLGDKNCARDLKSMLMDAMEYPQRTDQAFLDQHELLPLPDTEEPWVVPKPIIYAPPPPIYAPQAEQMDLGPAGVSQGQTEGGLMDNGTAQEGGGLKAWPPQSSSAPPDRLVQRSSGTQMWPPPKPPQHMDRTQLPDNLRPSRLVRHTDDGEESGDRTAKEHAPSDHVHSPRPDDRQSPSLEFRRSDSNVSSGDRRTEDGGVTNVIVVTDDHAPETGASRHLATGGAGRRGNEAEGRVSEGPGSDGVTAGDPALDRVYNSHKRVRTESGEDMRGSHPDQSNRQYPRPPIFFTGPSTWTDDSTDIMYEDLAPDVVPTVPGHIKLSETSDEAEIGRWGEHLVNEYLISLASQQHSDISYVEWVNQVQESGKPYDFVIRVTDRGDHRDEREIYIEVKSTLSSKKAFFELSSQEFQFAQTTKKNFHLYRVFNAGGELGSVRLKKLENLAAKMDAKEVRLCMVV